MTRKRIIDVSLVLAIPEAPLQLELAVRLLQRGLVMISAGVARTPLVFVGTLPNVHMVDHQTLARKGRIEAGLLSVLHDEELVFHAARGPEPVRDRRGLRLKNLLVGPIGQNRLQSGPTQKVLGKAAVMCRLSPITVITAGPHHAPVAQALPLRASIVFLPIDAQEMPPLVGEHADIDERAVSVGLRLNGVVANLHAIQCQRAHQRPAVGPDVPIVSSLLRTGTGMYNHQAIDPSIAIIVIVPEIDEWVSFKQGVAHQPAGVARIRAVQPIQAGGVIGVGGVHHDPVTNAPLRIVLSVGVLEVVVAKTAAGVNIALGEEQGVEFALAVSVHVVAEIHTQNQGFDGLCLCKVL